jgi:drug/metabolite transporter (DMT)-like permease
MSQDRSFRTIDLGLILMGMIWGTSYAVVKTALAEMTPLTFNAVRFIGASLATLAAAWAVERDLSLPRQDWGLVLVLGLFGSFGSVVLYVVGMAYTTTTNASLIIAAAPIVVALINAVTGAERLGPRNWLGVALGFVGIVLVITASGGGGVAGSATLLGDLLEVAAAVLFAVYLVLLKRLSPGARPLRVTVWSMLSATVLMCIVALPDLRATDWRSLSTFSWAGMAYSGILSVGLSGVIWQVGVRQVGSTRASLYTFLSPVVAVLVGRVFLHEVLTSGQMLGVAAVLLGLWLGRQE